MIFDAFALLVTKATFIGLRLVVLYLLAASLGSADFAPIAFGLTIAEIVRFVADWGIDTLSLRRFSTPDRQDASRHFRSVMGVKAAASAVAVALSLPLLAIGAGTTPAMTALLSLTAVTSLWLNLGINWLQARGRLRPAAVVMGGLGLLTLVLQVGAHAARLSPEGRFAVQVLMEAAMAAAVLRLAWSELAPAVGDAGPAAVASWLREATPIALATVLALAYSRFDQVYVRLFYPAATLGSYVLAARLVEPLLFLMVSLTSTIYARVSGLVQGRIDPGLIRRAAWRWTGGILFATSLLSVCLGVLGVAVIARFLPTFEATSPILIVLLVSVPFRCVNLCLTAFIQSFGHYRTILGISAVNFCLMLIIVLVLGRLFGPVGAAGAMVVGEVVNTAFQARALAAIFARWDGMFRPGGAGAVRLSA